MDRVGAVDREWREKPLRGLDVEGGMFQRHDLFLVGLEQPTPCRPAELLRLPLV